MLDDKVRRSIVFLRKLLPMNVQEMKGVLLVRSYYNVAVYIFSLGL
jgi:hypothetical protein